MSNKKGSDKRTTARILQPLTFTYKNIHASWPILLDLYPPRNLESGDGGLTPRPSVVYFHGGGLTVGNRTSWFPYWLEDRVTAAGMAFISVDYRLIPPSTGHHIIEDIKDLFHFLSSNLNTSIHDRHEATKDSTEPKSPLFEIDPSRIAVAGTSAGGLCAYLSVVHAEPKPKALLALYAMGGDFTLSHYLVPKTSVFFRGREMLDPKSFAEYLPPDCGGLESTSGSLLAYHPATAPIPGYPANPRMLLARLYLQLGNFLDIYTGTERLSDVLRSVFSSTPASQYDTDGNAIMEPTTNDMLWQKLRDISPKDIILFPQLHIDSSWPPVLLVHGSADTAVRVDESYHVQYLLKKANVPVKLRVVPNREHSFDYASDAEEAYGQSGGLFDEIQSFLVQTLHP